MFVVFCKMSELISLTSGDHWKFLLLPPPPHRIWSACGRLRWFVVVCSHAVPVVCRGLSFSHTHWHSSDTVSVSAVPVLCQTDNVTDTDTVTAQIDRVTDTDWLSESETVTVTVWVSDSQTRVSVPVSDSHTHLQRWLSWLVTFDLPAQRIVPQNCYPD